MRKKTSHLRLALLALGALAVLGLGLVASTYGQANLLAQETDDSKNQQQNLRDQNNYVKNIQREVKEAAREAKIDTTGIDKLLTDFQNCLSARASEVGTPEFWNNLMDCNTIQRDIEDQMRDFVRPQRDCAQQKRNIENRRKEKKSNLDRQINDIKRNDSSADVTALENDLFAKMEAHFATADQLSAGTCTVDTANTLMDLNRDIDGWFQESYSLLNDLQQKANEVQRVKQLANDYKNIQRQCKDMSREFKGFERDVQRAQKSGESSELTAAYEQVKGTYTALCDETNNGAIMKLKAAMDAGNADAGDDARNEFFSLQQDFWSIMGDVRQSAQEKEQQVREEKHKEQNLKNVNRDLTQRQRELKRMKRDVEKLKKRYERAAKKYLEKAERKQVLAEFAELTTQISDLIASYEKALTAAAESTTSASSAEDLDAYWYDHADELNELQMEFEELGNQARRIGDVVQMLTNGEKELKRVGKDLNRLREDPRAESVIPKLEDLLKQAQGGFEGAWAQVVSDPESAMENTKDIFELQEEWNYTLESLYDELDE